MKYPIPEAVKLVFNERQLISKKSSVPQLCHEAPQNVNHKGGILNQQLTCHNHLYQAMKFIR